jgi:hypothetical protein
MMRGFPAIQRWGSPPFSLTATHERGSPRVPSLQVAHHCRQLELRPVGATGRQRGCGGCDSGCPWAVADREPGASRERLTGRERPRQGGRRRGCLYPWRHPP